MATRIIRVIGDPVLNKTSKTVTDFGKKTTELVEDMLDTMYDSNGVGLAGPQVGVCRRLFIMHLDEDDVIEAINPQILKTKGKQRVMEGCLSCPDTWGYVRRPMKCVLKAQDRNGKWFERSFSELGAQCVCHENDHLDGVLYASKVIEWLDLDED